MKEKWTSALLSVESTLGDAVQALNTNDHRIVLLIDREERLKGTITDGDIRRALLRGQSMSSPSRDAMEASPITIHNDTTPQLAVQIMRRKGLMHLPVIDQAKRLVGLRTAQDLLMKEQRLNPVLLMAGGLGKRLRPLTENTPKPLLKVGQNPILQTTLEKLIDDGFFYFFISVNYLGEQVREFFGDGSQWGVQIEYLQESEPLGTAGAISLLDQTRITEPLLVMNGDLLTKVNFGELLDFHNVHNALATLCVREHEFKIPFGVVSGFESEMSRIEEKPAKKVFVNAGIYVLEPKLLDGQFFSGRCDMPTVLNRIVVGGDKVTMFPIHEYWIDVGNIQDFERAQFDVSD